MKGIKYAVLTRSVLIVEAAPARPLICSNSAVRKNDANFFSDMYTVPWYTKLSNALTSSWFTSFKITTGCLQGLSYKYNKDINNLYIEINLVRKQKCYLYYITSVNF